MAVTLFHRRKVINRIRIINKAPVEKEEATAKASTQQLYNMKIRGKTYGRRTISKQD